jgi:protease I
MKKALILTWEGYKDYEAIYPYYRLLEEEFEVDVISNTIGKVTGVLGGSIPCNRHISELTLDNTADFLLNYDLLIIPGGVNSLEKLRLHTGAIQLVKEWCDAGKIIGSICSGAQMLITAKVLNNRKVSAYYSMEQDIWNAGATFIDAPAVIDTNIVTSPHYKWVGQWMKSVIQTYNTLNNES